MALRSTRSLFAASGIVLSVGAGLLLHRAHGDVGVASSRNARPPPRSSVAEASERTQRFDFGKVLIRAASFLERDFKFTSNSPDCIEIESILGQPSCCVKATTNTKVISPYGDFGLNLRIRPSTQPGRHTWRGFAKPSTGTPFVAEATADLIPTLHIVWNSLARPEVDRGETAHREGIVQFVGDHKPQGITSVSSDPLVHWTVGEWSDRGRIDGLRQHLFEAANRGEAQLTSQEATRRLIASP